MAMSVNRDNEYSAECVGCIFLIKFIRVTFVHRMDVFLKSV